MAEGAFEAPSRGRVVAEKLRERREDRGCPRFLRGGAWTPGEIRSFQTTSVAKRRGLRFYWELSGVESRRDCRGAKGGAGREAAPAIVQARDGGDVGRVADGTVAVEVGPTGRAVGVKETEESG